MIAFIRGITLFEFLCVGNFLLLAYAVLVQNVALAAVLTGSTVATLWGRVRGQTNGDGGGK